VSYGSTVLYVLYAAKRLFVLAVNW